jgi:predicted Zn finger-like uncharacterized protein
MLIVCPGCKTRFSFDDQKVGAEGVKLRCTKCHAIFRVMRKAPLPVSPPPVAEPAPRTPIPPAAETGPRLKVLVANESEAFCGAVSKVLSVEHFDVFSYNDGKAAYAAIQELNPDVVLLDVALPSLYGFEICEAVRKDPALSSVKLILLASIYDKTRYKRSPNSLYGADGYIEKHHIPDSLVGMINNLVSGQKPVEPAEKAKTPSEEEGQAAPELLSRQELAAQEAVRAELKKDEEQETSAPAPAASPELPEAHVKARRLARIIVSDIVLYNQAKVEEGVRNGSLFELLADDIKEGRALYVRRVAEEIRRETDYLEDAFKELIARKKRELNLN